MSYISLDSSTSSTTVVVFDDELNIQAKFQKEHQQIYPSKGLVEHDLEEIYNNLIELMKNETINGNKIIENPIFKDRLLKMQGKVLAFQSNALRVLSAKLNPGQNIKIAGMIQKLVGTELRHELESLGIDIMGELGTLYEDSPNIRDGGSWQFTYMYYLGLIIGGGTNQIQKNIISERGLGMPREPKATQGVQ